MKVLLVPLSWGLGPPWIGSFPTQFMDAQSDWDIGSLEAGSTLSALCYVPYAVDELFLRCDRQGVLLDLVCNGVLVGGACRTAST